MTTTPACHTSRLSRRIPTPSPSAAWAQAAHRPADTNDSASPLDRKQWWSTCGWLLAGLYGGSLLGLTAHAVLPIVWIAFGPVCGATLAVVSQLAGRRFPMIVTLGVQLVYIFSLFMVGLYLLLQLL